MENTKLRLIPSNWFYNLSVYGFLRVLKEYCEVENLNEFFKDDGSVEIPIQKINLFEETDEIESGIKSVRLWNCIVEAYLDYLYHLNFIKLKFGKLSKKQLEKIQRELSSLKVLKTKNFSEKHKKIRGKLFSKSGFFQNFINPSQFKLNLEPLLFLTFKDFLIWSKQNIASFKCQFCANYPLLDEYLTQTKIQNKPLKKILEGLIFLNYRQLPILGPSETAFPNSFWNLQSSVPLCLVCNILFLFYPLGLTRINETQEIFINAPSFKLIWLLNQHIEKLHSIKGYKDVKTLIGSGFIDLAVDLNIKLGTWQKLSTEVLILEGKNLYFYEIPSTVLKLLEDKKIASFLKELNSLKLLHEFINGNFKIFEILTYRILRNPDKVSEDEFIKYFFNKISNPSWLASRLSKLYALINQHLKIHSEVLI